MSLPAQKKLHGGENGEVTGEEGDFYLHTSKIIILVYKRHFSLPSSSCFFGSASSSVNGTIWHKACILFFLQ